MYRTISLFLFVCFTTSTLYSQKNVGDTYKVGTVTDSTYGIIMYNSLMSISGIDSVRYDAMKLPMQGLVLDMYDNGKILHKGSYNKGRLVSFNNYYPDGQKERSFVTLSTTMCNLKVYYNSGKLKSEVDYRDGNARRWTDYYENGQIEFFEEYSGNNEYILSRKAFRADGKPDYELKLLNSKMRKYMQKEYYPDGKLHQEGELLYFADVADLRKDGNWETYSERGNLILVEHFTNGAVTEKQDSLALKSSALYVKQSKANKKKQEEQLVKEEKKKAAKEAADKKKSDEILAKMEEEERRNSGEPEKKKESTETLASNTTREEPKEEPKSEVPSKVSAEPEKERKKEPEKKNEGSNAKKTNATPSLPVEFKFADKDKNGKISAPEVSQAINAFFDDESGKLKPEDISKLIDYFFDQ